MRLLDQRFKVLAEFNRDTSRSVHGFPQANMFDQPELEALLRANLKRYPNAELRGNAEVTEVSDHRRTRCASRSPTAADGQTHMVEADYLLGCDGANSVVRAQIGSAMRDLKFEQRWLVVDVATDADLRPVGGCASGVRSGSRGHLHAHRRGPLPVGVSAAAPAKAPTTSARCRGLRPLIAPWTADVADSELTLLRVTEYTFRAQIADRWRRGNIFILGDAAHLTPPFIGQGMGAGLRDAMNLAWKIAGVRNGTLAADVLDSYEQERKPHTRQLIRLALNVGRAMTGGGHLGNLVRRLVLPRLRLLPGSARQGRRLHHASAASVAAGAQISPAGPARRHAVPESAAARRSAAR